MADETTVVTNKSGWKTKTGGGALILAGVAGLILHFTSPENDAAMSLQAAFTLIGSGISVLGLGDKLKKLTDVLKNK